MSSTFINTSGKTLSLSSSATATDRNIWAAAPGVTTSAIGAGHILYGDSDDDNFILFSPTDQIVIPTTPHGMYTISDSAWSSAYTLQAGVQNLVVSGSYDVVTGNSLDNLIITQSGPAMVSGGGGNDVFVLGTGSDTISDPQGSGSDVIYGFKNGTDHVRLDGSTRFSDWTQVQSALTQVGNDVQLNMGNGQTLTFRSELISNFSSSDFYLPVDTANMVLTFDDEFNSFSSSANGSTGWMTSWPYGGINNRAMPGNGDATYYSDASVGVNPFSVNNGVLDLTASVSPPGSNPDNMPYTSGVMTTYKSFTQTYGYFEIRAELPTGAGLWPSFYMQSADNTAELDIFEVLGISPTTLYATATQHVIGGASYSTSNTVIVSNTSTAFHTYGVDWEPNTITFYMDGNVIATAPTPVSMHQPMYMIIGMGVGASGSWAGAPTANSIFPATMQMDYVRAYATAATISTSGSAAIPLGTLSGQALLSGAADAGVPVTLLNTSGTMMATTTTDSTGKFTFANLAAGSYQVQYTAPSGQLLQPGSAANTTTGLTSAITLDAAQSLTLATETLVNPATIQSRVLYVESSTGTSSGDAGVTVSLLDSADTVVVGSGSDTLALSMSERSEPNGAQFTVSVDGTQIGGVQTTNANVLAGQTQTFDVEGTFAPGNHTVAVTYVNANNSLLIVNGTTIDGVAVANGNPVFSNNGTIDFGFTDQASAAVAPGSMVLGSGPDTLALTLSERAEAAGAQFTITVNGQQVGGVQTVTANSLTGQTQTLDVMGSFSGSNNTVAVDYLNATNSLLFVQGASIDGTAIASSNLTFSNNGSLGFSFSEPSSASSSANFVGSGPDSVALFTSERAEPAGARFTVGVDGQQVGGVQTVTANSLTGQQQQTDVLGNFAPGNHSVSVDYMNANNSLLFVNTATINGQTISGGSLVASNNGSLGFNFTTPAAPSPITIGSGSDTLALNISEDYYLGNAQFTVSVDGQQIGGVQAASAQHGNGQSQVFDVLGNFSGAHTVGINFLNDAGQPMPALGTDRNLYVGGASIDGTTIANSTLTLLTQGTQSFIFSH